VPEPPAAVVAELPESQLVQPQSADDEDGIELDIGDEPEVVLQPQAAPAERAHKSLSVDSDRAKLLTEVGCLFVERGRVAVSMLQRQYGMDFDDACKVLDELQDLGLIGPYLGGQRRDILLTRDQWLEKAGAV
jgi:S-DNA-T family DNA segregation ATPase FtsK/SpoIIIE